MDGMSDIRNEIEQRLGVFARPGAKAKMARAEKVMRDGSVHLDFSAAKEWLSAAKDAELRYIVADSKSALNANPDGKKFNYYRDLVLEAMKELKKRGFSRPGAKAAFAVDAGAIAKEILRQLGGGRFMSMVGGKNAFHGNFGGKPGLQVDIGKGAQGGINRLIVTLDPASDTYNMEFWRIAKGGLSTKKVSEASGVYADDLQRVFTDRTKFYTSMSRSSAKTEMAAIDAGMMDGAGNEVVIRMADGSRATARYNRGTGKWSLEGHADVPAFAKVRDLVAHLTKQGMSRPGAKAAMAKYRAFVYRGSPRSNVLVKATEWMDSATEAENAAKQIAASYRGKPGFNSGDYFADIAQETPEGAKTIKNNVRFSRPGAKAEMAKTPIRVTETEYAALAARDAVSRKILGDSQYQITPSDRTVRAAGDAAYKTALARHNAWDKAWKDAPNDAARAEIEARTEAAEAGMRVYRGSRPGAKATAAKPDDKTECADCETEQDKAGLKLMEKADKAVSDKIRTLIKEGKPQDQAVAIALDMKRRGEL